MALEYTSLKVLFFTTNLNDVNHQSLFRMKFPFFYRPADFASVVKVQPLLLLELLMGTSFTHSELSWLL